MTNILMAYSKEADEDFKLPLRPWMEKQINSGNFKGLEWEQDEQGQQTRMFRLPWVKKNLPDWEEYYKIFRAWAEHRGRQNGNINDSKLKSNFRGALNKSLDFEEVPNKSTLHQQTGNYKVYRILSPQEVRERKSKKVLTKEEQKNEASLASFQNNFDSGDFKTIEKTGMDFLDNMDIDDTTISGTFHTLDANANLTDFLVDSNDISYTQMTVVPPSLEECTAQGLAISPAGQSQYAAENPETIAVITQPNSIEMMAVEHEETTGPEIKTPDSNVAAVLNQLDQCGIAREDLKKCDLVIKYNGKIVVNESLHNMDSGYRIFYGDQNEQIKLLKMKNATEERLSDFNYPAVKLPPHNQAGSSISQILGKTDLGLVIRYDPATLRITAKRLCQSQIFFFDPYNWEQIQDPIKLEREQVVTLFSHGEYLCSFLEYYSKHNRFPPDLDIILSVGMKPKTEHEMRHIKGVQITLIPFVLKFFMQNRDCPNSSISLCFSNPNSMEQLLRQIHK